MSVVNLRLAECRLEVIVEISVKIARAEIIRN